MDSSGAVNFESLIPARSGRLYGKECCARQTTRANENFHHRARFDDQRDPLHAHASWSSVFQASQIRLLRDRHRVVRLRLRECARDLRSNRAQDLLERLRLQ